jgi:hypothetical protein
MKGNDFVQAAAKCCVLGPLYCRYAVPEIYDFVSRQERNAEAQNEKPAVSDGWTP